jgi:LuxR family maltose regulon positive regulatory protein
MLVTFHPVAPWFNVLGRLALARAALLVDDRTTSRSLLRELEHFLRAEPPKGGARLYLEDLRASVDAARQLPSDRAWALTEAELKVLQFLPTNLTLGDIATRLFVSRNTVKTHVAAIYRKLNATSRSEAVDLARRTGVLEDAEPRD